VKLFSFPIPFTTKLPDGGKHFHVLAWRQSFGLDTFKRGFYFGFFGEYLSDRDGKWHLGYGYHSITIDFDPADWAFGSDHGYYDGPHCSFALGPVRFNWQRDWCKKCMPDE
jgi:hypothetical protein